MSRRPARPTPCRRAENRSPRSGSTRDRQQRSGHSLIELVIVVTLVGTALSGAAVTLATLARVDRTLRDQQQRSEQWTRLAYQFRGDVRAANAGSTPASQDDVKPSDGKASDVDASAASLLKLERSRGREVEYRAAVERIERVVREGDQIVHRDTFYLGKNQSATFERIETAGGPIWALVVASDSAYGDSRLGACRVEAMLGTHANPRPTRTPRRRLPRSPRTPRPLRMPDTARAVADRPMRRRRRATRRRGAAMAAALICFFVVALFASAVAYRAAMSSRHVRAGRFATQSEWLAESGVQRARARLALSADYAGETWEIPASEFGPANAGRSGAVVIAVTRDDAASAERKVVVTATYPAESPLGVMRRLEFTWTSAARP